MGNNEKKEGANFTLVDLRRIIDEGEWGFGEAIGAHEHVGEPGSPYASRKPLHKRKVPAELQAHGEDHLHLLQVVRMEACMHCSAVTRSHELKPVVHVLLKQDKSRN